MIDAFLFGWRKMAFCKPWKLGMETTSRESYHAASHPHSNPDPNTSVTFSTPSCTKKPRGLHALSLTRSSSDVQPIRAPASGQRHRRRLKCHLGATRPDT